MSKNSKIKLEIKKKNEMLDKVIGDANDGRLRFSFSFDLAPFTGLE